MEIQIYPNSSRPGVGMKPHREAQRPFLPQHARLCPVLEAGSSLGFLVHAPLEPHEGIKVDYQGEGRYLLQYFLSPKPGQWQTLFSLQLSLPIGSLGVIKKEVMFEVANPPITEEDAAHIAEAFIQFHDLGTPAGGISLRGATNFKTPPGWDTVYSPVINMIERPIAPMLMVRVETDWYPHETDFRYVLQPGEGISCSHHLPIGQVFFVPREEPTLRDSTDAELAAIHQSRDEFLVKKAATQTNTRYGLQYSPHYSRQSRTTNDPG